MRHASTRRAAPRATRRVLFTPTMAICRGNKLYYYVAVPYTLLHSQILLRGCFSALRISSAPSCWSLRDQASRNGANQLQVFSLLERRLPHESMHPHGVIAPTSTLYILPRRKNRPEYVRRFTSAQLVLLKGKSDSELSTLPRLHTSRSKHDWGAGTPQLTRASTRAYGFILN